MHPAHAYSNTQHHALQRNTNYNVTFTTACKNLLWKTERETSHLTSYSPIHTRTQSSPTVVLVHLSQVSSVHVKYIYN